MEYDENLNHVNTRPKKITRKSEEQDVNEL
jgi:hypothetical protein